MENNQQLPYTAVTSNLPNDKDRIGFHIRRYTKAGDLGTIHLGLASQLDKLAKQGKASKFGHHRRNTEGT